MRRLMSIIGMLGTVTLLAAAAAVGGADDATREVVLQVWLGEEDAAEESAVLMQLRTRSGSAIATESRVGDTTVSVEGVVVRMERDAYTVSLAVSKREARVVAGLDEPLVSLTSATTHTEVSLGGEPTAFAAATPGPTWRLRLEAVE